MVTKVMFLKVGEWSYRVMIGQQVQNSFSGAEEEPHKGKPITIPLEGGACSKWNLNLHSGKVLTVGGVLHHRISIFTRKQSFRKSNLNNCLSPLCQTLRYEC